MPGSCAGVHCWRWGRRWCRASGTGEKSTAGKNLTQKKSRDTSHCSYRDDLGFIQERDRGGLFKLCRQPCNRPAPGSGDAVPRHALS